MITAIICSMLESPSTSDSDEMTTGVSKSTCLEPRIKHLMKEKRIFSRAANKLVRRGEILRANISLTAKFTLKSMRGHSRSNNIRKLLREEIVEWVLYHPNVNP